MHTELIAMLTALSIGPIVATQSSSNEPLRRINVIGCVQRSEPDTALTGTTVLEPEQTRYVLVQITLAADTTQSATADSIAERVPIYRLDSSADSILAPQVGRKVEISGTLTPSPGQPATSDAKVPRPQAPLLKVERMTAIAGAASSCARKETGA
jgi:hypothetical protein